MHTESFLLVRLLKICLKILTLRRGRKGRKSLAPKKKTELNDVCNAKKDFEKYNQNAIYYRKCGLVWSYLDDNICVILSSKEFCTAVHSVNNFDRFLSLHFYRACSKIYFSECIYTVEPLIPTFG